MIRRLDITQAARVLHQHRQAATKLGALSPDLRPRDRAEGYAIQAALASHSAHPLFGWKIAATSEAGQKHINVTGPMAGRILAETVLPNGGTASMRGNQMWSGEPEFAFRIGHDLPPRSEPYGVAEVLAAVDTLHPPIEIPDSRFADFVNAGEAQLIADNACANLFVLGPPVANTGAPATWSRNGRRSRCVATDIPAMAATCSAIPAWLSPGWPTNCASSA